MAYRTNIKEYDDVIDSDKYKKIKSPSKKPLQNVSYKKKSDKDFLYVKEFGEFYISKCRFGGTKLTNDKQFTIKDLYDFYNGNIDANLFEHITNPLGSTKPANERTFPAQMRNYMLIRENIDLLKGEYARRPFRFIINIPGEDSYNDYTKALYSAINSHLQEKLVNLIEELQNGTEQKEQITIEQFIDNFRDNYNDARIKLADDAIHIIMQEEKIKSKWNEMFEDYIIAGEPFSYKNVVRSDVVYEDINPLEADYDLSSSSKYSEDGEFFCIRNILTISDVVDEYYDMVTEDEFKKIQEASATLGYTPKTFFSTLNRLDGTDNINGDRIEVIKYFMKLKKKVGYLTYTDPETGEIQNMYVSEEYSLRKEEGESIEWEWVNEVWQGERIHGCIYTTPRPLAMQRNKMNNKSYCKLPGNSFKFSNKNSANISVLMMGIPYEIVYRIINYKIELLVNKFDGDIVLMDINAIPRNEGEDEETFFFNAKARGWALIDRNQTKVDKTWNQYQVLNMSTFEEIKNLISYLDYVRARWDSLIGVNRQRKGESYSSDGKGVTEEAIFRGSVISDYIFRKFDEFKIVELQGLLDFSQIAWLEGKKGIYRNDMLRNEFVNIDPELFSTTEYRLFPTDSTEELERLDFIKSNLHSMIQNGLAHGSIVDVTMANSISDMRDVLRKSQQALENIEMQKAKSLQEQEQVKKDLEKEFAYFENLLDIKKINAEYDRKDINTMIQVDSNIYNSQGDGDTDNNGILDINEINDRYNERIKNYNEMQDKDKERALKDKISKRDIDSKLKMKEMDLKIAKENKNKYDTKK